MLPESIQTVVDTAFYGIVTGGIGFLVHFLSRLADGVSGLNTKIGIVIEKMADHDYRIQRLEKKEDRR